MYLDKVHGLVQHIRRLGQRLLLLETASGGQEKHLFDDKALLKAFRWPAVGQQSAMAVSCERQGRHSSLEAVLQATMHG